MNVIFISPNFPPNYYQFCVALKKHGARVLGIGEEHFDALHPALKDSLDAYYYVADMKRYDDMLKAVAYFTFKYGKIDSLDSHGEFWLGLEARLREDFNIPGQKTLDLARNRSKLGMKTVFAEHGIPHAEGQPVTTLEDARRFAERFGFPLILKPDVGAGVLETFRINTMTELEERLGTLPGGYLLEQFLPGNLVSFDGLTDRNGKVLFYTSHEFPRAVLDVVQSGDSLHYFSRRELEPNLVSLGLKTVSAFGIRERFFHMELFRTANEDYTVLEINARPPGGYTTDMMDFALDCNLYDLWAKTIVEGSPTFDYERLYHTAHASRRHVYRYRLSHEQLLEKLGRMCVAHMEVPRVYSRELGDYTYLLRHEALDELKRGAGLVIEREPNG